MPQQERPTMTSLFAIFGLCAGLLLVPVTALQAQTEAPRDLRDLRYCELIVMKRDGISLKTTVYNTLGQNDCPAEAWQAITADAAETQFDALKVVLNGPRYWVLDGIVASGATAEGETVTVGGLGFTARAVLELSLFDLRTKPYQERAVNRSTQWIYAAGKPMFLLQGPDGARYAMQSYAQIVDKTQTYDDLASLADRLALPAGWSFAVSVPDADMTYPAAGQAIVVQDELDNTYQKLPAGQ
jgi:hypothetical protein